MSSTSPTDLASLPSLTESAILDCLHTRFKTNEIYTSVGGDVLISTNPFQPTALFTPEVFESYLVPAPQRSCLRPHVFALAHDAYDTATSEANSHVTIVVGGESGSGKTELTRLFVSFLTELSNSSLSSPSLEERILSANPILEAFGNAATQRNDDSSRFGRHLKIWMDQRACRVTSAQISTLLLEKSRVVKVNPGERNFHIFYYLLAGASQSYELREALQLSNARAEEFDNLRDTATTTTTTTSQQQQPQPQIHSDTDDGVAFSRVLRAFKSLNFSQDDITQILGILAGILHLCNVQFTQDAPGDDAPARVMRKDVLAVAAELLGLSSDALVLALTQRLISAQENVYQTRNCVQSRDARNALVKAIYVRVFDALVNRINAVLSSSSSSSTVKRPSSIGVVDIFGFETFQHNSLEQLLINYANERLSFVFLTNAIEKELALYKSEGVKVDVTSLSDTLLHKAELVLAVFENKPTGGIFALMDDEVALPKASDATLLAKILALNPAVVERTKSPLQFLITHYPGNVVYDVNDFLDKSRDKLEVALDACMRASSLAFIKSAWNTTSNSTKPSAASKRTVGTDFHAQLDDLMTSIASTSIKFVRCIKPNDVKSPEIFDKEKVALQLRCAGVLDVARVRTRGFSIRLSFSVFLSRYGCLLSSPPQTLPVRDNVVTIINLLTSSSSQVHVGTNTLVFLRPNARDELESMREKALRARVIRIQKVIRGHQARAQLKEARAVLHLVSTATLAAKTATNGFANHPVSVSPHVIILREVTALAAQLPSRVPSVVEARQMLTKLERVELAWRMVTDASAGTTGGSADVAYKEAVLVGISKDLPEMRVLANKIDMEARARLVEQELREAIASRDATKLTKALSHGKSFPALTSEATVLLERLRAEQEAVAAVEATNKTGDQDLIRAAIKNLEALGLDAHPAAQAAAKKIKHKRHESRDVAFLARQQELDDLVDRMMELLQEGVAAEVHDLQACRAAILSKGFETQPKIADGFKQLGELLETKTQTPLGAAIMALENKADGRWGGDLSAQDIETMVEALMVAKQRLSKVVPSKRDHDEVARGEEMERKCREQIKIQSAMEETLRARDYDKLRDCLSDADRIFLDNDLTRRARAVCSRKNTTHKTSQTPHQRHREIRRVSTKDFKKKSAERLSKVRSDPAHFSVRRFHDLRLAEDYARKLGFFASTVDRTTQRSMLEWTGRVIPKSLTLAASQDDRLAHRSILLNKAILGFCGDVALPYPTQLVHQVLEAAFLDPPLANELWVQMMKQCTNNVELESERRAWQLLCIASGTVGPHDLQLEDCVLSFLAAKVDERPVVDALIVEYNKFALNKFLHLLEYGHADVIPTQNEIRAWLERPPCSATIMLPSGEELVRDFPVPPSSDVTDLIESLCALQQISTDLIPILSLFVEVDNKNAVDRRNRTLRRRRAGLMTATLEDQTAGTTATTTTRRGSASGMLRRLSAVLAGSKTGPGNNNNNNKPGSLHVSFSFGPTTTPRGMGSLTRASSSLTMKATKSKIESLPVECSPEPLGPDEYLGNVLNRYLRNDKIPVFVLRRLYVPPVEPPGAMKNSPYIRVAYLEAVEEFIAGRWAVSTQDVMCRLTKLLVLETLGKMPSSTSRLAGFVKEFLPITIGKRFPHVTMEQWADAVSGAGIGNVGTEDDDLRRAFLVLMREACPLYGCISFNVRKGKFESSMFSLGFQGVFITDPEDGQLIRPIIPHARIKKVSIVMEGFRMEVRGGDGGPDAPIETLSFVTQQAREVATLVWAFGVR